MSAALRPVLDGDRRRARVLAAFPHAIYLEVEQLEPEQLELERPGPSTAPLVVSIVTADGLVHPNSAVLRRTSLERPLSSCRAGAAAWIGRGTIELGSLVIAVARWWDPSPILPAVDRAGLAERVSEMEVLLALHAPDPPRQLADRVAAVASALGSSALGPSEPSDAPVAAGRQLVGLGPGLTPSGDDVLCGLFAAAILLVRSLAEHAARRGDDQGVVVAERVGALTRAAERIATAAHGRTTTLSEALLWHAARGEASGPLLGLLRALTGAAPLGPSLDRLLAVGSTSGRDLALGATAGARLALSLSVAPAAPPAAPAPPAPPAAPAAPPAASCSPFAVPSASRSRP